MSISPVALAAKKVIDAAWLHGDAYDLASQAAFALESEQMLMSPEIAEELKRLRDRVAELEARDAALLTVMERVRSMHVSVTEMDGRSAKPGCSVWGLLSDLATVRGLNRAPEHNQWSGEPYPEEAYSGHSDEDVTPQVTKLRALLAGQRADGEHYAATHHAYRVGRDLPETGGA